MAKPGQVEDQLGGRLPPVKEKEGQGAGQKGDNGHDRDGGDGPCGAQHVSSSFSSSLVPQDQQAQHNHAQRDEQHLILAEEVAQDNQKQHRHPGPQNGGRCLR